ncbi:hypothetical protein BTHI11S_00345 [Bosea thiooxidans]
MWGALAGEDLGDSDPVGIGRGLAAGEEPGDLVGEIGGQHLVGIEVEKPIMAALFFGEALLQAVAGPGMMNHAGAERLGHGLRAVGGAGIDDDDIVAECAGGLDRPADAVCFILRDDEDRERRHGFVQSL